jgi:creatinine amidohydrolase
VCPEVDVLLAPTLWYGASDRYGASDHHLACGATLSLTTKTFRTVLTDLARSAARAGCTRVLIVNGHGGNAPMRNVIAVDASRDEGVLVPTCCHWELIEPSEESPNFAGHVGRFETSLMVVARSELVHLDRARPSPGSLPGRPRGLNVRAHDLWQQIDGFTDDPRAASAEFGRHRVDRCSQALARAISETGSA